MVRRLLARPRGGAPDELRTLEPDVRRTLAQRRFASLRHRLVGLVMLVLLPALALVLYTQADERGVAIGQVNADAMRLIHIATSNQAGQIEAARQVLTALARLPQLRVKDAAQCSAFMAEMLSVYPSYLNLAVAAPDGNISCSALPMGAPVNVADRAYFKRAMETRRFSIGDYQIGRVTRVPSINYAYPLQNAAGDVEAVLFIAQNLSWLTSALANVQFPRDAVLLVVDGNGTVLARVPHGEDVVGRTLAEERVLTTVTARQERGVFEMQDSNGVARLWAHAPLIPGHDLQATIGMSRAVAFEDINRRLARNLAALALVTLVALSAARFGAKFLFRQVDALVDATRKLASGDLAARAPLFGGGSEIEALAGAFNRMAETLQTRDRELRIAEERTRTAEIQLAVTCAQIDIARQIQRSLLPEDPLTLAGVRLAGRCIPAIAVGGDYFGYFPRGRGGVDSLIGDVSGHGVGAALLMAEARTMFMAERLVTPSAAAMLRKLNDLLYDDLDCAGLFMTACCATFNADDRVLSYANAGHPPPLLLRRNASHCTSLHCDGMLLGIRKGVEFAEETVALHAGDIVVFYTDGITEARNDTGELFGVTRLETAIVASRNEEPEVLIEAVLSALSGFAGDRQHEDDLTMVVMKVTT